VLAKLRSRRKAKVEKTKDGESLDDLRAEASIFEQDTRSRPASRALLSGLAKGQRPRDILTRGERQRSWLEIMSV
jgi:hypothetical protein